MDAYRKFENGQLGGCGDRTTVLCLEKPVFLRQLASEPRLALNLLSDGLRWLRRWGARDALVNTQEDNRRSLRLYQRSGVVLQPNGLSVLELVLGHPVTVPPGTASPAHPEGRP